MFDSGFGFDSISGDFVIRDGNASTENLALSGPAANVVMIGRTGLIDKDYDQTAVVYANFGSSLPIAGALKKSQPARSCVENRRKMLMYDVYTALFRRFSP